MKALKKYFAMLASAGFVMAVAATSHAAFTSHPPVQTLSATSGLTGGTPTVAINAVTLKTIGTNTALTPGSPMTWTSPTPGAGFLVADQYIQLDTNINTLNGGVQIYTDNKNVAANPQYSGLVSSYTATPAGLVMEADTTQKLPTAWRASTFTLTSVNPVDPNAKAGDSFLWFFHEDKSQVAVWTSSSTSFGVVSQGPNAGQGSAGGGDQYVTVYAAPGTPLFKHGFDSSGNETLSVVNTTSNSSGVHFAQALADGSIAFGGFKSGLTSTYIYTEADFTGALAAQRYSTNRLILEAYSL